MKGLKKAGLAAFAALFAGSLLLFWLVPALGQKEASQTENRALAQLPAFTLQGFLSGTYQDALEEAVGDQLLFSEAARSLVKDAQAAALEGEQALLYRANPALKNGYVQIAEGYYAYQGDERRIVEKPWDTAGQAEALAAFAAPFNALEGTPVYLYFINNSRSVNFDHPEEAGEISRWVRSFFSLQSAGEFTFSGYDDFCRWFYQTDHHWNDAGFYRGYTEILALLKPGDAPLGPGERLDTGAVFNGSYARVTKSLRGSEHFIVRSFDLPKHAVSVNGKRGTYGRLSAYLKGRFSSEPLANHYANCYGGDYGEIHYDFGGEGKGKLLVVASSYSNPINALIASHFDQTWVIDLRYYPDYAGEPFDVNAFVKAHEIDAVLLLGDLALFLPGGAEEGGGG